MAKLKSLIQFDGSLEGLSAYKMKGVKETILRAAHGPSKEDIHTKPRYANTRRNIAENRGRNKAVSGLMMAFEPLKPLADFDTAGQLNKLLRVMQKSDTVSAWGQRGVCPSRFPALLEGFRLTKDLPFDSVVRGEVKTYLDRATLEAVVELPELLPDLTFFPPRGYGYCRGVAVLGVAPDWLHASPNYRTDGDYGNCYAQAARTDWFLAGKGLAPATLSLHLPYTPPSGAFALVLTVAVQLGEPGITGAIEPVRQRIGSGKILAAV